MCTVAKYPAHSLTLEPLRTLTAISVSALKSNPIISAIAPMSTRTSSDRTPQYPLICFSHNQDRILLPHTKTLEETVKLLHYYLDLPKDDDIELTAKWGGHKEWVRIVQHVWPYIGGTIEDIKVTTYAKGPLSP
ncbi:hypothetical protein FRC18_010183 [Serendipita sp. 400]|nr:hypothetical protein FRC18_010183 [Serendipita sp. 400]